MTLSVRGEQPIKTLNTIVLGYQTHAWGADKRAAPFRWPTDIATLSCRELAKLITTNLVTHPVTCVIDRYIHTYVRWIIVLGFGRDLLNKELVYDCTPNQPHLLLNYCVSDSQDVWLMHPSCPT